MALDDVFGTSFPSPDVGAEETPVTPLDPEGASPDPSPIVFEGFASPQPLLAERPTRFVNRMRDSVNALVHVPDGDGDGGTDARIHLSPIMTIPVPTLYGNELFPGRDAAAYPMLHWPDNHPWTPDGGQPYDEYLLGLYAFHTMSGMMHCEGGDLYSYPLDGPWEADDAPWNLAMSWAADVAPLLLRVNLARLTAFATLDWQSEGPLLGRLYALWGVEDTPEQVTALDGDAVMALEPLLRVVSDLPYRPYEED